jgi:hypothetical protein
LYFRLVERGHPSPPNLHIELTSIAGEMAAGQVLEKLDQLMQRVTRVVAGRRFGGLGVRHTPCVILAVPGLPRRLAVARLS